MEVDSLESGPLDRPHLGNSVHDHRSAKDICENKDMELFEAVQATCCRHICRCLVDH